MNQDLELRLQALLDDELPPSEAREIRRLVASDPAAARLLAELKAVKTAFRQHKQIAPVPETREFYWNKIARQIEHEERKRPASLPTWPLRWRRWLTVLAGATALVVAVVVSVHQSLPQIAFNQISVTAAGYEARTIRDQSSGLTYVFLHDTKAAPDTQEQPARVRNDGSSFNVETE